MTSRIPKRIKRIKLDETFIQETTFATTPQKRAIILASLRLPFSFRKDSIQTDFNLSLEAVFDVLAQEKAAMKKKVRKHVWKKLKIMLLANELNELFSDVQFKLLDRVANGKVHFKTGKKVFGYFIFACWCNYRTQHFKRHPLTSKPLGEWTTITTSGNRNHTFVNVDAAGFELQAQATRTQTETDDSDGYYQEWFQRILTYLDDCVADNFFSFRDANIYKMYLINKCYSGWTKKDLVQKSDFTRTVCYDALKKVEDHLKTVDWYMRVRDEDDDNS